MSDSHWVGVTFCMGIEAKAGVRGLGLIMPGPHHLLVLYVVAMFDQFLGMRFQPKNQSQH